MAGATGFATGVGVGMVTLATLACTTGATAWVASGAGINGAAMGGGGKEYGGGGTPYWDRSPLWEVEESLPVEGMT